MNIFKARLLVSILFITIFGCVLGSSLSHAAQPLQRKVEGFELGITADKAIELMTSTYPGCEIKKRNHKEDNGEMTEIVTELTVDAGEVDKTTKQLLCSEPNRVLDRVSVKIVNPDSNASQPVYEIALRKTYTDPENYPDKADFTVDAVSKALFAKYGKPSGQMRAKTTSIHDPAPAPVKKGKKGKAAPAPPAPDVEESYNVVYVWGGPGLKPQLFSFCMEKCGNFYMTADLLITKKPNQVPKNTFYVQALAIRMIDTQLDAKQYDWVYERIKRIRTKGKLY